MNPTSPQEYWTRLELKTAFSNIDKHITQYNRQHQDKKQHIRGGVLATLYRVAEAFVRQNHHIQQLQQHPVPCRLNNCMLAYQLKVNRRTIINHLNKLEQAGILTKTFRGTYADYEIQIPAHILTSPKETNTTTATPHKAKKQPPIRPQQHLEKRNIQAKNSELVENPEKAARENTAQEPPQPLQGKKSNHRDTETGYNPKATEAREKSPTLSTAQKREHNLGAAGGAKKQTPAWQKAMVIELYRYAIPALYPYHEFSPETERSILNKLYNHVYGGFKDQTFTQKHWEEYQKTLLERIDMVADWKARPGEKDKQTGIAVEKFIVNPLTYFDINCAYGFVQTENWLLLKRRRLALYKAEAELEKARREVLKDGDRLRMYRKWETRFKNKKLPEVMPMFYRAMQRIQEQLTAVRH